MEVKKKTGSWKSHWKVQDLLANERFSGRYWTSSLPRRVRRVPSLGEEDAGSEASVWELRERREREEKRRHEAEELDVGSEEEIALFLPTPTFMASADDE